MDTFNLKIVSFDKILLEKEVVYCAIYTETGKTGFKFRHESFVTVLQENSSIEYDDFEGDNGNIPILNGLFSFRDNHCIISVMPADV